jgi:hypothetical protein
MALLYYITGHGFGHARRSAEVIRHLLELIPELTVHIRSNAAAHIFSELNTRQTQLHMVALDSGAIEKNPLEVDILQTISRLGQSLRDKKKVLAAEIEFIHRHQITQIISDIPFLAGDVAEAADIPCVAITNFTWDWIYEAFPVVDPDQFEMIDEVRKSYSKMQGILKLPFGGNTHIFRAMTDVPLIASRSHRSKDQILKTLSLAQNDARPRVLLGMRGGISTQVLAAAANKSLDYLYLYPQAVPKGFPTNVLSIEPNHTLSFADLLSVSDVVISKLGYGMVSDCIANQAALLWPNRFGFHEDDVMKREAGRYFRMREIGHEDFFAGRWKEPIRQLLAQPQSIETLGSNGAEICARWIANWIEG